MAFTEFVCRSGGSNLNGGGIAAGTEPGTSAAYTCTNSNWDGTSSFTPTDGSTPASSVTVGDFASVYNDGATVAVYVARVTAVAAGANGAITLSTTAKSGTAPTSSATARTIKVGGAWKGPNAAEAFPFGFITAALANSGGNQPRVNLKNDAQYNVSSSVAHSLAGPVTFQGYTSSFGDLGKFTVDGSTNAIVLLNLTGTQNHLIDCIGQNNGSTGVNDGIVVGGGRSLALRVVANNIRGNGLKGGGAAVAKAIECETFACNSSNTSGNAGIASFECIRCSSHDSAGSNTSGFVNCTTLEDCISDSNGLNGIRITTGFPLIQIRSCDFYNNAGSGILLSNGSGLVVVDNSNFIKNGAYGIDVAQSSIDVLMQNCGFGAGTQANTSGQKNTVASTVVIESGTVSYANDVTPWVDPANGDFRINLGAAKGAGRGTFTQTTPMTGAVTNATNATPIVVTAARTMRTGETVTIASVGGNTAANGTWVATNVSATTFSLNGSVGNGAYTSGGTYSVAYAGAVGYPDIGGAQHLDAGGGLLVNPGLNGGFL